MFIQLVSSYRSPLFLHIHDRRGRSSFYFLGALTRSLSSLRSKDKEKSTCLFVAISTKYLSQDKNHLVMGSSPESFISRPMLSVRAVCLIGLQLLSAKQFQLL